jgi:hypothetical protein
MKKKLSKTKLAVIVLVLVTALSVSVGGWFVSGQIKTRNAAQKDGTYFRDKYQNTADSDKCVKEYYDTYPEDKPQNHKPDSVYLAPPCPGIAQ